MKPSLIKGENYVLNQTVVMMSKLNKFCGFQILMYFHAKKQEYLFHNEFTDASLRASIMFVKL